MRPEITLVVAVAENGVIGARGGMPWHLPADLHHFKQLTYGKPVLMGRLTWDSIGKPLPGRRNLVLTSDPEWQAEGAERVASLDEAVARAEADGAAELMVIGGAAVYRLALPRARRIYLTRIHAEPDGDTHFPEIDDEAWEQVACRERPADERNPHDLSFVTLERMR
ncbi:dihydrofolate reductase [Thioalkalivibrio sp. XN8]|uniref:dihydrofolate reductase n=1 Tax=Thioalkalivibrio sp. XN8 TaxID=2712863 RepID=UPI0013EAD53C|nr:dihydrofolate reductase [Thioalkalivibrio sp. XN8]NGP54079.1 dihydrofolate reductase [Thioalkalivibrio sp. XN8]